MSILTLSQYEANVVKLPLNFRNSLDISIIKKWFLIAFLVLFVLMCIRGYSNYDLILACIMAGVIIFNNAQYVFDKTIVCEKGNLYLRFPFHKLKIEAGSKFVIKQSAVRKSIYIQIKDRNVLVANYDKEADLKDIVKVYNQQLELLLN